MLSAAQTPSPTPSSDREHRRDEHLRERVHRRLPHAQNADRDEHGERRQRRSPPADDEGDGCQAGDRDEPRRLDEEVLERQEDVLDEEVADRLGDAEDERRRVLDVVEPDWICASSQS